MHCADIVLNVEDLPDVEEVLGAATAVFRSERVKARKNSGGAVLEVGSSLRCELCRKYVFLMTFN